MPLFHQSFVGQGRVNHNPVTTRLDADPITQGSYGYNVGTLTASGQVTARIQAAAFVWGQSKRSAASTVSEETGTENPPQERMKANYKSLSGTDIQTYDS